MISVKMKTTRKSNLLSLYKDKIKNLIKSFSKAMGYKLPKMIIDDILRGVSPVRSHTFQTYAPSYKKAIIKYYSKLHGKSITPVNLKLSGKMLGSIKYIEGNKLIDLASIVFTDKKAKYHTVDGIKRKDGTVKRKMLPVGKGEKFNAEISEAIREAIIKSISVEGR